MNNLENQSNFLFYTAEDGTTNIQVVLSNDTVWVTQSGMADIFESSKQSISYHLNNIYSEKELTKLSTVKEILTVQKEGDRDVQRTIVYYNLDAIISVGYRISSPKATKFRIWATGRLKEYMIKGFTLDDERLKQAKTLFGKDYFDELIERIREIRASERRFYQKITDLYALSSDYDKNSPLTQTFFATVQNKLEYAITKHTAPEIIKFRAGSEKPHMGLTSWKNEKQGGKIQKSDVSVAKNYLKHDEMSELNQIVNMYLDFAELQAKKSNLMEMSEWANKLDAFLEFNNYDLLKDAGKIKAVVAKNFAEKEYQKFRLIQDKEFKSDFDKVMEKAKNTGELPKEKKLQSSKEEIEEPLSEFNRKLKKGLGHNPKEN